MLQLGSCGLLLGTLLGGRRSTLRFSSISLTHPLEKEETEDSGWGCPSPKLKVVDELLGGKAQGVDEVHPEYLQSLDAMEVSWLTRLCVMLCKKICRFFFK